MPKMKTHRSSAKRLRVTKNGKVMAHKAFGRHLLAHKSMGRKRNLRKVATLSLAATRHIKSILPYA